MSMKSLDRHNSQKLMSMLLWSESKKDNERENERKTERKKERKKERKRERET